MIKSGYDETCSTRLPIKLYAASKALDLSLFWDLHWTLQSEASCPLKLRGHVPPQIFEPSGFLMQLPKDKK